MDEDDNSVLASPTGILGCLRLLAEEAATLKLYQTVEAIIEALDTASRECNAQFTTCEDDRRLMNEAIRIH